MFCGRVTERSTLDRVVSDVRGRRGGVIALVGQAGIGKTELLSQALDGVADVEIVRAIGAEFEAQMPFASMHQLCQPLLPALGRLPPPLAVAIKTAFGLSSGPQPQAAAVGLGFLKLLVQHAESSPVLCVVDDAHWLDRESANVMAFIARRTAGRPLGLVFAGRARAMPASLAFVPRLELGPLSDEEATALLGVELRAPGDRAVRERVIAEAQGNPLALLEFSRSAIPSTPPMGSAERDPLAARIEASMQRRIGDMHESARLLVWLAAADPTGDCELLQRACRALELPWATAVAEAEQAGLLSVGTHVRFLHPLMRSAAYRQASPAARRTAHEALAKATDGGRDLDRQAWHRGRAASGPDEEVASALERTAARAQTRSGVSEASAFLEQAAALTPDPRRRAMRLLAAAERRRDGGQTQLAMCLLDAADLPPLDAAHRALASRLRARLRFDLNRDDEAAKQLLAAANELAQVDAATARETYLEAFSAAVFVGRLADPEGLAEIAAAARALLPAPAPVGPADLLLDGLTTRLLRGHGAAAPMLVQAVKEYQRADPPAPHQVGALWLTCSVATEVGDISALKSLAERQVSAARELGAYTALPVALSYRSLAHILAGELEHAQQLIDEAYNISAELGTPPLIYTDISVAAWRGDAERTKSLAARGRRDAATRGEGRMLSAIDYAELVLFNGLGRYEDALASGRAACENGEFPAWIPFEVAEAAGRAGRPEDGRTAVRQLAAISQASGTPWAVGVELRSRALVADDQRAERLYRQAVEYLKQAPPNVHLARTHLVFGEWLRRHGRRREARDHLVCAHEELSRIGASAFAARAERELAATGQRPRRSTEDAREYLTHREMLIARMAADGATTREISAELFLSSRTVDAHLRSVFRKLDITSRRQLATHHTLIAAEA